MDPRRWKGPKAPANTVVDTIKINVSTALPPSQSNASLPIPPPIHPLPSLPLDPLIIPPPTPSTCGGSLLATTPPPPPSSNKSPSSITGAQDTSWPSWFRDAHRLLSSQNLGGDFTFAPGGCSAGFRSDNRPPAVHYWISRGRTIQPRISNITDFEENWWKWWKGLQPAWRAVFEVECPLDRTHRPALTGGHDWSAINKHGRNAFFFIMATLLWWGAASSKPPSKDPGWMVAVEDLGWVLDGLLGVNAPPAPTSKSSRLRQR
ncbi:hypothetical protein K443DRAFT_135355 [Laccaria amethystina LaAM-08-1]|uniref:Uncharacterized protein n=1 Tax=Laccaria amethystina LaAM-08-1 TaxID=1095629 RepID=A0A0C9X379_9AGAR|nr:hypothetical protein K443DRAFT_135355 [Laccaria amethystina LaAM-08-1]